MRCRAVLALTISTLVVATTSFAQRTALDPVVETANGIDELRPRLLAFADTVAARDPALASQAVAWVGLHFARAGEPDSAVAW